MSKPKAINFEGGSVDEEQRVKNDVLGILLDMRSGAVAADISTKFDEVLNAVLDTGGKGELTIKLFIRPSKMGLGGCVIEVETEHECKTKKPELQIGRSVFFVTRDRRLTREDPAQTGMFEEINGTQEVRR